MKVNGIIPGDLETDAKCTTPSPSHKISETFRNLLKLSNSVPKQVRPLKPSELEPKDKTLTSSPPSRRQTIGENRDSSSLPRKHAAKPPILACIPSLKIGEDTCLIPIRIGHDRSSVPRTCPATVRLPCQERDSWRRSLQKNGYCKSKERSSHPVAAPAGGSGTVSGRACAKRKGEHVVDGDRERKRPRYQDLGLSFLDIDCEAPEVHGFKPSSKDQPKPKKAGLRTHSPPKSPAMRSRRGLVPPGREVDNGADSRRGTRVPVQPCPRPDRAGPKGSRLSPVQKDPDFSPPPAQCARRKQDVHAARGQSQSSRERREGSSQPERGERSSGSSSDAVTRPSPTAVGGSKQPHTSTSPLVSLASGAGEGGSSVSPLAGSCFPGSPTKASAENSGPERGSAEDRDLSDPELDLGDFADAVSSSGSDDEPLLSLQEILDRSVRPPATPQKGSFPEPRVLLHKLPVLADRGRPVNYRNTLEQMLKEKEENQRVKDTESKLLLSCKEDLLSLAEDSTSDGTGEESFSQEHRAILKRFSVVSNAIPDLHPGEDVFTLCNFGQFFNQQSLDLKSCEVTPQNAAQKTLLQASPDDLLFLISSGMLQKAYRSSPCQPAVSRWLFQMMSVHLDRKTSTVILQSMKDIALISADHITANKSRKFEVWTPSIQDTVIIFLNMGVPFATLFPLEALQPPFTEADILQSIDCLEEVSSRKQEHASFPEHSFENVIKYLALCMALCPRAYSDEELLLLMTVACRVSLDTRLRLLPMEDMCWLLQNLLNNTRDWDSQLPRICLALTDLTQNHHNLRRLVQLLPDHKRGRQLRKHLSVSIISKLLNHRCAYKPATPEFKLSALQRYLPRMRPSSLLSAFFLAKKTADQREEEHSAASQDQQAYYLCYTLLALINEASNFDTFPSNQKDNLQLLSAELEKHVKCDIREGEKWLYRSKVKDFVARIYTRWQILLHKSRPLQGKLHDYWQPLPEDTLSSIQESQQAEPEAVLNTDSHTA